MAEVSRLVAVAEGRLDGGDADAALSAATTALALAKEAGDVAAAADAFRLVIQAHSQAGSHDEAAGLARQELSDARQRGDATGRAAAAVALADALLAGGGAAAAAQEALESAGDAAATAGTAGSRRLEAAARLAEANANLRRGDLRCGDARASYQAALESAKMAIESFEAAGDVRGQAAAAHAVAAARLRCGNFEGAVRAAKDALRLWRGLGADRHEVVELQSLALWHLQAGQPQSALPFAQAALERSREAACPVAWEVAASRLMCQALCAARHFDRALQVAEEAARRARERGDAPGELAGLRSALEVHMSRGRPWEALRIAAQAVDLAASAGAKREQASLLRTSAKLNLQVHRLDDALTAAKCSLKLCQDDAEAGGGGPPEHLGSVRALVAALRASELGKEAVQALEDERERCSGEEDPRGEAIALLVMVGLHLERGAHQDAVWAIEDAQALFEECGDKAGEGAALQMLAEVHLSSKDYDAAIDAASQAAALLQAAGRRRSQLGALLLALQAQELKLASTKLESTSTKFRQGALKATEMAKDAVGVAEHVADPALLAASLCVLSRASRVAMRLEEAIKAADGAAALFAEAADRSGEAQALLLGADGRAAAPGPVLNERARADAAKALGVFRQLGDARGEAQAEAVLDRVDRSDQPPPPQEAAAPADGAPAPLQPLPPAAQAAPPRAAALSAGGIEQINRTVRATVADIVGVEGLDDDTPLMQTGLTSQSAVLLRNALMKEIGGASLPFTMMFDFPSVSALTDFFVQRAEEE